MVRLLEIEWLKVRHHRPFWILIGLYALCVTVICSGGKIFLQYIESRGANFNGIGPSILPIYDYPDVWQNITFVAAIFKIFLGFIMVISIANESNYRTLRQNIIDGLSKREFFLGKILVCCVLAGASTLLLLIIGVVVASVYSSVQGVEYMFDSMSFLLAHFLAVFSFLVFSLFLVLLIPKPGLLIVGLFMYTLIFEPMVSAIITYAPHGKEWLRPVAQYLPITSMNNLNHIPFPRYVMQEIQDYILLKEVIIASVWVLVNAALGYYVLRRKDW